MLIATSDSFTIHSSSSQKVDFEVVEQIFSTISHLQQYYTARIRTISILQYFATWPITQKIWYCTLYHYKVPTLVQRDFEAYKKL
jgi:hypothetical protein